MVPVLVVAGGAAIGLATLAGAWLARRSAARRELAFGAAAGALLVIAGVHLLPDAWSGAGQAGVPAWAVPAAAAASFALAGLAARAGCTCQSEPKGRGAAWTVKGEWGGGRGATQERATREGGASKAPRRRAENTAERETAGGAGAAGALAAHRLLEGAALALASSPTVAVALIVHALAEGLAAGTLLRRRAAWWLAAMCASPIVGVAFVEIRPVPPGAEPLLLAVAAGVLGQAARVSLAAAFRHVRLARITAWTPAAAALIAAAVTALAVRGAG